MARRNGKIALRFVLIMGLANFFADMTYEGARSVTGPFLGSLGASAAVVEFTAGLGELAGYALRLISGTISDRTRRYWLVTIVGYCVNMLSVPALALAGQWPFASGLVIAERTGRAIRKPSTDAMLSFAGQQIGSGRVFGLHEALDQIGATIGPLLVSFVLFRHGSFRTGFALLLIPALLTIFVIGIARRLFPEPHTLEETSEIPATIPPSFWLYLVAGACVAAGFADFSLIAYHFQRARVVGPQLIPIYYAAAMVMGAIGGLTFGKLLDLLGLPVILLAMSLAALFAPLVFLGGMWMALAGMIFWGLGMGAQGSLLQSLIANLITGDKRGTAFGLFDAGFGIAWFAGSWLMGILYDYSITSLVIFSVVFQLLALPLFIAAARKPRTRI